LITFQVDEGVLNYRNFNEISDKVLLLNLERAVLALMKTGWWPMAISRYVEDEVSEHNKSNTPEVLRGELNRFLSDRNLPTLAGNDMSPVI
jgi:hypothetical protein